MDGATVALTTVGLAVASSSIAKVGISVDKASSGVGHVVGAPVGCEMLPGESVPSSVGKKVEPPSVESSVGVAVGLFTL